MGSPAGAASNPPDPFARPPVALEPRNPPPGRPHGVGIPLSGPGTQDRESPARRLRRPTPAGGPLSPGQGTSGRKQGRFAVCPNPAVPAWRRSVNVWASVQSLIESQPPTPNPRPGDRRSRIGRVSACWTNGRWMRDSYRPLLAALWILAQVSRSVTVRLKTRPPSIESGSTQK